MSGSTSAQLVNNSKVIYGQIASFAAPILGLVSFCYVLGYIRMYAYLMKFGATWLLSSSSSSHFLTSSAGLLALILFAVFMNFFTYLSIDKIKNTSDFDKIIQSRISKLKFLSIALFCLGIVGSLYPEYIPKYIYGISSAIFIISSISTLLMMILTTKIDKRSDSISLLLQVLIMILLLFFFFFQKGVGEADRDLNSDTSWLKHVSVSKPGVPPSLRFFLFVDHYYYCINLDDPLKRIYPLSIGDIESISAKPAVKDSTTS